MKVVLLVIGKTEETYLEEGINNYCKRLKHYLSFEIQVIPALKNTKSLSPEQQKNKEGELILKQVQANDYLVLLDENGKVHSSTGFAQLLNTTFHKVSGRMVFLVGGPYGFDETIYARANDKISLSAMTFSHQMVRLIFTEQLYRAMTILKNEPYHHE